MVAISEKVFLSIQELRIIADELESRYKIANDAILYSGRDEITKRVKDVYLYTKRYMCYLKAAEMPPYDLDGKNAWIEVRDRALKFINCGINFLKNAKKIQKSIRKVEEGLPSLQRE